MAPKTLQQRVGNQIRLARWRKRLDQEEAAARIGLSYRYYADLERGARNPTLDVLAAIAKALDVSVADLVDVEGRKRLDLTRMALEPPRRGRRPKVKRANKQR